jgi:D-alanine-D-alanine ligase
MEAVSSPAVIFGGPSPEHDVSVLTGLQAAHTLAQGGATVIAVYWAKTGAFFSVDPTLEGEAFAEGAPKGAKELRLVASDGGGFIAAKGGLLAKEKPLDVSAIVNCCHGGPGEDGTLQAALDLAGLPYSGPSVAGAALGMDKLAFAGAVAAAGLPVLPRALVEPGRAGPPHLLAATPGPFIVKPRFGGSSIGIEVVEDWPTACALAKDSVHLRRGAVVEPYRPTSFDLNVAVRTWPELQLSAIERPLRSPGSAEILGYRDKYLGGEGMVSAPRELPADIPESLEKALRDAATSVAAIALVRGVARIDFLVDEGGWYVNEVNTIPGSLAKYLWVDPAAVPFATLLADLLAEAVRRPTFRPDATGADGLVLRSASSIARKLG